MQKVEAFIPIEASREEAATRCRSQQGFRFCQTGALGLASIAIVALSWRAVVIPIIRERWVYDRCAVEVPNATQQV